MLSDALHEFGDSLADSTLEVLAYGCLTPHHAGQFKAFVKQLRSKYALNAIIKGESGSGRCTIRRSPGSRPRASTTAS